MPNLQKLWRALRTWRLNLGELCGLGVFFQRLVITPIEHARMRVTQPDIWYAKQVMSVQTKEQILDLLRRHQRELQRLGVRRCGLFGSFVRNEAQTGSDVDIGVEFEPDQKTFDHFMQLALFLEDLFDRKVDLITVEALSPYIGPHILREVEYVSIGA
nr:nucleotidyltransferase family protein [Chloroflexus sp.]